jgi:hypothetical protein
MVNAGPNGGQMVCGTGKSNSGHTGSTCFWATPTTFAEIEFHTSGGVLANYPNMYATALKIRHGMEQPAM